MCSIFVDANILLGFWKLEDGRVPAGLLLPLVELHDHVLITQQIAEEVQRNKLSVFLSSCSDFPKKIPAQIPENMIKKKCTHEVNGLLGALQQSIKNTQKEWDSVVAEIAKEIAFEADLTSTMLAPLTSKAQSPNQDQLDRARDRRERGNPPGKRSDPLGDQISWEQFLDAAEGKESVFIITRDRDFTAKVGNGLVLNPLLRADLGKKGVKEINVYDNLATAVKAIKLSKLVDLKIEDKALEKLEVEEEAHYPKPPYLTWHDGAWKCPKCNNVNSNTGLSAHPSQYGGWSYWAMCTNCGYRFDTGEPYDE